MLDDLNLTESGGGVRGMTLWQFWILDFGFWILDFGFWILDFGFWILERSPTPL
jgi:hypothetical protein